jgi:hypothetical protein
MNMSLNGILDNFILPEGAAEAIAKQNLQSVQIEDGVTRLSGHDKGMAFRFFIHPEYQEVESKKKGYEVYKEVEMIEWLVDKNTKPTERVNLLPDGLLAKDIRGNFVGGRYLEAYKRFKEGRKAPGLPLNKWGILSDSEVATLAHNNIFTVEQLAEQDRAVIASKFPQSYLEALDRAVTFVGSKQFVKDNEQNAKKMAELEEQNKALLERLSALEGKVSISTTASKAKKTGSSEDLKA